MSMGAVHTRHSEENSAHLSGVADGGLIKTTEDVMQERFRQISNGHARHLCFRAVHLTIKPLASHGP